MKNIFTIFAIILSQVALCQTVETKKIQELRDSITLVKDLSAKNIEILELRFDTLENNSKVNQEKSNNSIQELQTALGQKLKEVEIGSFELIEKFIYSNPIAESRRKIDSVQEVQITIRNGVVVHIHILTDGNIIYESSYPIPFNKVNNKDFILKYKGDRSEFPDRIILSNYIMYTPKDQSNYYVNKDIEIPIDSLHTKFRIYRGREINQVVDFRVYTDILGLSETNENAAILSEVNIKLPVHNSNIGRTHLYFFKDVTIDFSFSRFDEAHKKIPLSDFSRNKMYQLNWFSSKVNLGVINTSNFKNNNSYSLDFVLGFNLSDIQDSINVITSHTLPYLGVQASLKIHSAINFKMLFRYPIYFQYGGELTQFENLDSGIKTIHAPEVEAVWKPDESKYSSFFGRCRFVSMTNGGYDYFMIHIGYNLSLSDFISGTKK